MQRHREDPKRNHEGYADPTPYQAIKNLERREEGYERFRKVLRIIFTACELAGFEVDGRIVLVDKKTGKVWR